MRIRVSGGKEKKKKNEGRAELKDTKKRKGDVAQMVRASACRAEG